MLDRMKYDVDVARPGRFSSIMPCGVRVQSLTSLYVLDNRVPASQ
jgi:hypothetical protein